MSKYYIRLLWQRANLLRQSVLWGPNILKFRTLVQRAYGLNMCSTYYNFHYYNPHHHYYQLNNYILWQRRRRICRLYKIFANEERDSQKGQRQETVFWIYKKEPTTMSVNHGLFWLQKETTPLNKLKSTSGTSLENGTNKNRISIARGDQERGSIESLTRSCSLSIQRSASSGTSSWNMGWSLSPCWIHKEIASIVLLF